MKGFTPVCLKKMYYSGSHFSCFSRFQVRWHGMDIDFIFVSDVKFNCGSFKKKKSMSSARQHPVFPEKHFIWLQNHISGNIFFHPIDEKYYWECTLSSTFYQTPFELSDQKIIFDDSSVNYTLEYIKIWVSVVS